MPRSGVQEASTKAHHTVTHCYPAGHRGGVLGVLKHKVLDDKEKKKKFGAHKKGLGSHRTTKMSMPKLQKREKKNCIEFN